MHTLITGYRQTDHVNGNGLDNRRANLREATTAENGRNVPKLRGVSRFKGVSWHKARSRWQVRIHIAPGNERHLGYFTDEMQAAMAYDAWARICYGEFACLNFPEPGERSALD